MSFKIETPSINGISEKEQLAQIKTYLIQLSDTLNWALNTVGGQDDIFSSYQSASAGTVSVGNGAKHVSKYAQLKDLIVKSADIVEAVSEEVTRKLNGRYVAHSDFGTYKEETEMKLLETSRGLEAQFSNLQTIITEENDGKDAKTVIVNATIRAGKIDDDEVSGEPIYGIEIGQTTDAGEGGFNRFARFVSDRISFYDAAGEELAAFTNRSIEITNAVVRETMQVGKYLFDASDGLAIKYIGG